MTHELSHTPEIPIKQWYLKPDVSVAISLVIIRVIIFHTFSRLEREQGWSITSPCFRALHTSKRTFSTRVQFITLGIEKMPDTRGKDFLICTDVNNCKWQFENRNSTRFEAFEGRKKIGKYFSWKEVLLLQLFRGWLKNSSRFERVTPRQTT